MKKILLIAATALLAMAATAQEPKKVLFIGNSYTEVNNLPQLVQKVSESAGSRVEYRSNTPGGCTFEQHCTNQSMSLIQEGGWDVVVLQEQSQLPSFPWSQVNRECLPYAARLADSVYAHNPEGEVMYYMTWGRQNGDQQNAIYFDSLGTYEGMDDLLYARYLYMARENDASVCPVGRVWRYLRTNHEEIELYSGDGSHPSMLGSYAGACAFYTMIFHESPERITYIPEGVDERDARTIRNAVDTVVWQDLSFWLRQTDTIPDTTQTDTTNHDTTQVAINRLVAYTMACSIQPNPVSEQLRITISEFTSPCEACIFDVRGRKVRAFKLHRESSTINVADLPRGVYILGVTDFSSKAVARFVKQ